MQPHASVSSPPLSSGQWFNARLSCVIHAVILIFLLLKTTALESPCLYDLNLRGELGEMFRSQAKGRGVGEEEQGFEICGGSNGCLHRFLQKFPTKPP
jgi:hypothetical protein